MCALVSIYRLQMISSNKSPQKNLPKIQLMNKKDLNYLICLVKLLNNKVISLWRVKCSLDLVIKSKQ